LLYILAAFGNRLSRTEVHVFARHDRVALAGALLAALACPVPTSKVIAADVGEMQATATRATEAPNELAKLQVAAGTPAGPATESAIKPTAATGTPAKAASAGAMSPSAAASRLTSARGQRAASHRAGWSGGYYARRSGGGGAGIILGVRY
jgi:hypothetical protein